MNAPPIRRSAWRREVEVARALVNASNLVASISVHPFTFLRTTSRIAETVSFTFQSTPTFQLDRNLSVSDDKTIAELMQRMNALNKNGVILKDYCT